MPATLYRLINLKFFNNSEVGTLIIPVFKDELN